MNVSDTFQIARPEFLWLIWILPVLAGIAFVMRRIDRRALARWFSPHLFAQIAAGVSARRRAAKLALLLASLFFSILALAEPKWGVTEQTIFSQGRDILVLLDVSKSMLATDVAPSRLERVKLDLLDMLTSLRGDRIGLIVFAGAPVIKCPLTVDYAFFRSVLEKAGPQAVSRGGTFIGDAIRLGLESFSDQSPQKKVMILISDGEDQGSYPLDAAKTAALRGIRIYTVGLGDREIGSRIQVDGDYVKDEGKIVWTKLNPEELRQIAATTGGAYVPAGTRSVDLDQIYRQKISADEAQEYEETKRQMIESRYQLFLFFGLVLLLAESVLPDRGRPRPEIPS